ncbi:UNVERIFIED_ORG: TRAP-type C4-dicarboxylate transport system substrate-binding protein [Martelella mediterranea]
MKLKSLLATCVAAGIGLGAVPASAETFRAATWNASGSMNDRFLTDFANLVKEYSDGSVEFEVFPGGVLFPADGSLQGISSGVAQLANITAAYIPSDLPVDAVASDMSFLADDQLALAFAKTEVTFFNKQMQEELAKKKGIVFVTSFSIGIYYPICGFDLKDMSGLDGKKVRTSSSAQIDFIGEYGGVPVSVPGTEIYTGIQRGSLDCALGDPLFLTEFFKLSEVAKSVYQLPLGSNANGGYYVNQGFWQDRSPEERRDILHALSRATAASMIDYGKRVDAAWETSKKDGVALNAPTAEDEQALAAFKEKFVANLPQMEMDKRGISDPTELIDEMQASMEKWKKLLAGIDRNNVDQVTQLLDEQIFDKVDVNTYGVN